MRKTNRRIATLAGTIAVTTGVGIAFAAWTTNGTGTGAAASRTSSDLVVTPAVTTDTLYPTGSSDLGVSIRNPNEYKVHVTSLTLAAGGITASSANCNAASVTYTTQTNGSSGWDVDPGQTITLDLADAVAMSNAANDDCKSNTFTVNLTANGASAS